MTFETATVNVLELIDALANRMISTGTKWIDGDATITTAGSPRGRVLKYDVAGQNLWISFCAANWGGAYSNNLTTRGILVLISSGWDAANHRPSGSVEVMQLPVYGNIAVSTWDEAYANHVLQYWLWYEEDILVILTQTASTGVADSVNLFALEHNTVKEYDDGGSNFFFYQTCQHVGYISGASEASSYGKGPYQWSMPSGWSAFNLPIRKYVHPFVSALPVSRRNNFSISGSDNFADGQDLNGVSCAIMPARGRKSVANGKVYMAFPVVFSDPTETYRNPVATMKSFFPVDVGQGLADGDLINIPVSWNGAPAETWQYIYKRIVSPDGGELTVAIKYAEV